MSKHLGDDVEGIIPESTLSVYISVSRIVVYQYSSVFI